MRYPYLTPFLVLWTTATPPAAAQPAGHQAGEEEAVLTVLDRYMHAISNNDPVALAEMQMPDGMIFSWRPSPDGVGQVRSRPYARPFAAPSGDERVWRERYWAPTVLIRGGIATVWTPYEFWVDGETSHCGVDVFTFVRAEGTWRVAGSLYTVEPEACVELRPADPSAMRPAP